MPKDIINKGHTGGEKGQHSLDKIWSNPLCAYCYKKAEKLSSAIYLVTDFISENDPLQKKLREKSLCLLSKVVFLSRLNKKHTQEENVIGHTDVESIMIEIREVVALLTIAESCRYISTMNTNILKREYEKLAHLLQSRGGELGEDYQFPANFFEVPFSREMKESQVAQEEGVVRDKGHKSIMSDRLHKGSFMPQKTQEQNKGHSNVYRSSTRNKQSGSGSASRSNKTSIRHNERKQAILNLLDTKEKVGVKDVAGIVQGCSEKTIQRELLSLVKQGVLRKEGERRWSMYSLA